MNISTVRSSYPKLIFADYLEVLTRNYVSMAYVDLERVPLKLEIEEISVGLEIAIPVGLIINELLTNALKHAFPDNRQGIIQVIFRCQADGQLYLAVCDDGSGLSRKFSIPLSVFYGHPSGQYSGRSARCSVTGAVSASTRNPVLSDV
jgi:two-component sensor histidine kinase